MSRLTELLHIFNPSVSMNLENILNVTALSALKKKNKVVLLLKA